MFIIQPQQLHSEMDLHCIVGRYIDKRPYFPNDLCSFEFEIWIGNDGLWILQIF